MPSTDDLPYIVFGAPQILEEDIEAVAQCLRSGWIGTGPKVRKFVEDFAAYQRIPAEHVAAVNSCTAALHVSLVACDLEPGSEVITTPLTFCASVNAIIHAGLTPVLADIDPDTQCISPAAIEAAITPRTKAIMPVHFAGRSCEMDEIMDIAHRHDLRVIEDCAHAIETEFGSQKVGTFGDFGCFSFYVTKNVTTGEGGMIVGRDESLVSRARILSLHGMDKDAWKRFSDDGYKHYQVTECGFKYNLTDLQAVLGINQLRRVEQNWQRRLKVWNGYMEAFADLPVGLPYPLDPKHKHGLHLFTLRVPQKAPISRDGFIGALHREGIGTGVHYLSVPEHPYYQSRYGWRPEMWPHAMQAGRETVSLPLSAVISEQMQARITSTVRKVLS